MWNLLKKLSAIFLIAIFLSPGVLIANSDAQMLLRSGIRYDFDGVDERTYKNTPTSFTSDTSGSWCAWFLFDTLSGADNTFINVMGYGDTTTGGTFDNFNFGARKNLANYGDSEFHFAWNWRNDTTSNLIAGATDLTTGVRYFGCVVSSGTAWTMYLNGVAETTTLGVVGTNNGDWFGDASFAGTPRIAVGNTFRNNAWAPVSIDGRVDNVFITSDVLTAAQVLALYNGAKTIHPCVTITCSNVHSFWKMGEDENGSITTTYDTKGNNHLTSENMENTDFSIGSNY